MKKTLWTVAGTAAGMIVLAVVVGLLVIYTGAYNVAATEAHTSMTRWALSRLQHNSVADRAASIAGSVPTDSASLEHGFDHFHNMCVQCHGAPGMERGELGKGMRPQPPRLEEEAHEWTDAELFWITKHGIKLAGMPAFGPTHDDDALWGVVGFIRVLEEMTEEEYAARVRALDESDAGGHSHAPGTPEHEH